MPSDSAIQFPCDFPVKVVGHQRADFEARIVTLARAHVPDLGEGAVRSRPSQGGNYLAVTLTVRATSQAQLDALYRALSGADDVLMVL